MPKIPAIETLIEKYPNGNAPDVAKVVGGTVEKNFNNPKYTAYKDTCAIRVSHALNLAGDPIPWAGGNIDNPYRKGTKVRTDKGGNGKYYIYSTLDMRAYLIVRYGQPKKFPGGAETKEKIKGLKGIIAFGWVHIDLWNGTGCERSCYFEDPRTDQILLWETHSTNDSKK